MSLVRPVPGFVPPVVGLPAANAIVPFVPPVVGGAAAVGGLIGGAPPLVVVGGAIVAGVLLGAAVEQVWGWANGRRGTVSTLPPDVDFQFPDGSEAGYVGNEVSNLSLRIVFDGYAGAWLPASTGRFLWYFVTQGSPPSQKVMAMRAIGEDGAVGGVVYRPTTPSGGPQWMPLNTTWRFVDADPDGTQTERPKVPAYVPNPAGVPLLPPPSPLPEAEPLPDQPKLVPPVAVPTIPGSRPVDPAPAGVPTPTTPRTSPPPATLPRVPEFPAPVTPKAPAPTGTQTQPDGTLVPTSKPPVVKTPTDVHVIGGVPIPGNGPRPTPEGTAKELGRIENKLARLLDPKSDGPGQPMDRLKWLRDNITNIIDFFYAIQAGGSYELSSPCEVDENGDRVVRSVEYAGSLQSFGVLNNKLDALAALLQEHKDLKQPICRQTPAVGEPVTVNFVQVD